jgi:hypothetical protein
MVLANSTDLLMPQMHGYHMYSSRTYIPISVYVKGSGQLYAHAGRMNIMVLPT